MRHREHMGQRRIPLKRQSKAPVVNRIVIVCRAGNPKKEAKKVLKFRRFRKLFFVNIATRARAKSGIEFQESAASQEHRPWFRLFRKHLPESRFGKCLRLSDGGNSARLVPRKLHDSFYTAASANKRSRVFDSETRGCIFPVAQRLTN